MHVTGESLNAIKDFGNFGTSSREGSGHWASLFRSAALRHKGCIYSFNMQPEDHMSDRKMKDERKTVVILILMQETSIGCLTSSPWV